MGNYGADPRQYDDTELTVQAYLNFGAILVVLFLTNILRRRQNILKNEIDQKNLTPPDFTVYAMNLPIDKTQEEVTQWLKDYEQENDLQIVKVNYCYDIKETVKACRELDKWQKMKNYVIHYRKVKCKEHNVTEDEAREKGIDIDPPRVDYDYCCIKETFPTFDEICVKVKELEADLQALKKEMEVGTEKDLYVGKAFITVEKQSQATKLAKDFKMHPLIRAVFFVYYRILKCKVTKFERRFWEGKRVILERAAEPADVYWENISVTDAQRFFKTLITYSITAIMLGATFGLYFSLNLLKEHLEERAEDSSSSSDLWLLRLVTFGTSLIVVLINTVLRLAIRMLSSFEKHSTHTKFHLSVAFKLTIATFINTALLPLFTRLEVEKWFEPGGLSITIFYNTLSVAFVGPLLRIFAVGYFIKLYKMWKEKRKGENSKMTQRQANALFEGPVMDIATWYSTTGLLFCLICLYTPIVPILPLIGMAGVLLQYWIEKYLLLRRYQVPEATGSAMANFYANLLPYGLLLYGIGNHVFLDELSDGKNKHGQVAMWFMVGYILLPVRIILNIFTDKVNRDDEPSYSRVRLNFIQDYDRSNPMTANEAKTQFLRDLKANQNDDDDDEEDKQELDEELNKLEQGDKFSAVLDYGKLFKGLEHKGFNKFSRRSKRAGYKGKDRRKTGLNLFMLKGQHMAQKGGKGKRKKKNPFNKGLGSLIKRNAKKTTGSKLIYFYCISN
jgi:hypothetical protein